MKPLFIPRVRLNQLQALLETTLKECSVLTAIERKLAALLIIAEMFKQAMIRDAASATSKTALDGFRDRRTSAFMHAVEAEMVFPHTDEAILKALNQLAEVLFSYDYEIIKLPVDEQTSATTNMLSEIKKLDLAPLQPTGLLRWPSVIEESNRSFVEEAMKYLHQSTEVAKTASATELAPALAEALEDLYRFMYGSLLIEPSDEMQTAYDNIAAKVKALRRSL